MKMNDESITHDALALYEYTIDFPQSPFAISAKAQREDIGSAQYRSHIFRFAKEIETASDRILKTHPNLYDELMEKVGCWDFEVIPKIADRFADKWWETKAVKIEPYLLELAGLGLQNYELTIHWSKTIDVQARTYEQAKQLARASVSYADDIDSIE
jgi:hypothetical protein